MRRKGALEHGDIDPIHSVEYGDYMMTRNSKCVWTLLLAFVLAVVLLPTPASAVGPPAITLDPGVPTGSTVTPIIDSGETFNDFLFEGLPDGIGLAPGPFTNTVDVFVAHEQTHVPFFGAADFQDASVSRLTLDVTTAAVLDAGVALPPSAGYLRFCSASMAGPAEGFSRFTLFLNEEANDIVPVPVGASYGPDPAIAPNRQAGYTVALDIASGAFIQIEGMGRLNHENTVAIPGGWNSHAILTTDDTFNAPSAQLYLYLAGRESDVWNDRGSLWAFRVTATDAGRVDAADAFNGANDYLDIQPGDDWQGRFIRVPKEIARGQTAEVPQEALEQWSNDNNIFQFIRLEDLAYDKRGGDDDSGSDNDFDGKRVVYIADTGRSRIVPDTATGRMTRGPAGTVGFADNGRVFRMVFNKKNPRKVDSFSVFADGDTPGTPEFVPMRNPDNMDTSEQSLMVQEDAREAKIWRYDFSSATWSVVATVNDPSGESSGIVDASEWFGPGSWLLDVQGHGVNVVEEVQPDGILFKRESGQLMRMLIPGS
jgi:hypothetical protein